MKAMLKRLANNENQNSYANKLRKRRFALFMEVAKKLPRPLKIIDIGGTENYWEKMGFVSQSDIEITLVNTKEVETKYPNLKSVAGDARNLQQFQDNSFHIAFSNSVIEHVGTFNDQQKMVSEMRRVAPRIYLQTPNRYFPIEPHFLFPFFQYVPTKVRVWLLMNFQMGWYPKQTNREKAMALASSVRLMTFSELKKLFPNTKIIRERFWGITKSFVVLEGFTE